MDDATDLNTFDWNANASAMPVSRDHCTFWASTLAKKVAHASILHSNPILCSVLLICSHLLLACSEPSVPDSEVARL